MKIKSAIALTAMVLFVLLIPVIASGIRRAFVSYRLKQTEAMDPHSKKIKGPHDSIADEARRFTEDMPVNPQLVNLKHLRGPENWDIKSRVWLELPSDKSLPIALWQDIAHNSLNTMDLLTGKESSVPLDGIVAYCDGNTIFVWSSSGLICLAWDWLKDESFATFAQTGPYDVFKFLDDPSKLRIGKVYPSGPVIYCDDKNYSMFVDVIRLSQSGAQMIDMINCEPSSLNPIGSGLFYRAKNGSLFYRDLRSEPGNECTRFPDRYELSLVYGPNFGFVESDLSAIWIFDATFDELLSSGVPAFGHALSPPVAFNVPNSTADPSLTYAPRPTTKYTFPSPIDIATGNSDSWTQLDSWIIRIYSKGDKRLFDVYEIPSQQSNSTHSSLSQSENH